MRNLFGRSSFLAVALGLALTAAYAAPAAPGPAATPTYAFLSLIGDKLDIVIAQPDTGSRADKAPRIPPLDIADPVFDNVAATAASEAVRRAVPKAELAFLNSRSPVLFGKQLELFAEKDGVMSIPDAIRTALKNEKADYLVLIGKYRGESEFQTAGFPDGTGMIEGLGFYLDSATEARSRDVAEAGRGYIAPFAFMRVVIVDAASSRIIGRRTIKASTTISSANALDGAGSPWAAMTSAEKVSAISRLIQREVGRAIPPMLKSEKPETGK